MGTKIQDSVIAITGASSGIGRALAIQACKEGAKVALSDVNEGELEETRKLCLQHTSHVLITILDVSKRSQVNNWADEVVNHYGKVNVVVNNAGVNLSASFDDMTQKDFEWVMDIDFWGVVYGCRAFLPHLKKADWGQVVNISSLFGLMSVPNQSAYNAAKFAVRGFSESLRMELELAGDNVGVSCIHPGGVNTNIVNNARFGKQVGKSFAVEKQKEFFAKKLAKTSPETAAKDILNGIKNNTKRVLVGTDAKVLDIIQRILPTRYQQIILRVTKK